MAIGFNPASNDTNKSPKAGPTAEKAAGAPNPTAPNQLMPLGAPPPDFASLVDGWVKAIHKLFWPQTQVAAESQSPSGAKSEESEGHSEGSKRDKPKATVNGASPDIRNGVEFKELYNEDGKVIGKKSQRSDEIHHYGNPLNGGLA